MSVEHFLSSERDTPSTAREDGTTSASGELRDERNPTETPSGHGEDKSNMDGGGAEDGIDVTASAFERWSIRMGLKSEWTRQIYFHHVHGLLSSCGNKPANRITDSDVQDYINTLPGRPSRIVAIAAIRSFLKEVGRTVRDIDLGHAKERRAIEPITDSDFEKMCLNSNLQQESYLRLVKDTGGRSSAICNLKVEDFRGDHIVLKADAAKNKMSSYAPISIRTRQTLERYISEYKPTERLFPNMTRNRAWEMVDRLAKKAGIRTRVYPHLFRHMRALEFRKANAQTDTVLNALGWTDTKQYDKRYGRRTAMDTLKEAARTLEPQIQVPPNNAISQLASLLEQGKIDLPTFQAALVQLNRKETAQTKHVDGYQ